MKRRLPIHQPVQVGVPHATTQTFLGREIAMFGQTYEVTVEEHRALECVAKKAGVSLDTYLASVCKGSSVAGAKSVLRRAVIPYLPADYHWPVVTS